MKHHHQLFILAFLAILANSQAQDTITVHEFSSIRTSMNVMGFHRYAFSFGQNGPTEIGWSGKNLVPYFQAYPMAAAELKKARRFGLIADLAGAAAVQSLVLVLLNTERYPSYWQRRRRGIFLGELAIGTTLAIVFDKKSRKHFRNSIDKYNNSVLSPN